MSLSPQLQPTDYEALETIESREDRESAYVENAIYPKRDARGIRYTKGTSVKSTPRGWQSLDVILRSDANSAGALPKKKLRTSRILTGIAIASALVAVGGFAASAREGFELQRLSASGAVLLAGGALTLGFAVGAGVTYGQSKRGYEKAVDVYNDSLGMRLGLYTPQGAYIPPEGVLVDEEGFIILDQQEIRYQEPPPAAPAEPLPEIDDGAEADAPPADPLDPPDPEDPADPQDPPDPQDGAAGDDEADTPHAGAVSLLPRHTGP